MSGTAAGDHFFKNYFDPESPLTAEWRQATSLFDIATEEEIEEMKAFLLDKKQKGILDQFMNQCDHTQERGAYTLFACISQSKNGHQNE